MRARRVKIQSPVWSPRSQKSVLHQLELEAALEKCRKQITFTEKRIREWKEKAESQMQNITERTSPVIRQGFHRTLVGIDELERELAAFRKREKSLQAEIKALALSPAQATLRARLQGELAALVMERFAKDRAIDSALRKLRRVLQERAALTAKMVKIAGDLEFAATADFDAGRFVALLDSLPVDLAAQSHDWVNWFFGQESEKEPHTVGSKVAVLPETLASCGVFRPGETVYLTKAQAAKLPSDESAKPVPTPEEMEASVAVKTDTGKLPAAAPPPLRPEDGDVIGVSGFPVR